MVLVLILSLAVTYFFSTPEFAIIKLRNNVKKIGFAAVEQCLTEEASKKLEPIRKLAGNKIVSSILSAVSKNEYVGVLVEKAKQINWSVDDIIKNRRKASVTIRFDYDNNIVGTVDMELLKINGKWYINNIYNLNVEKLML